MNYELTCTECCKYYLSSNWEIEQILPFVKDHFWHASTFTLKIIDIHTVYLTHLFLLRKNWTNKECAKEISEWIAERMDEVNNSNSKKMSSIDFERREQIEKMLTFYSDVEEKNCKDSPVSSAYMFHRGRQLLAIDILKSINFIFEQGK